jgi:enoyl-CoA hydratase/carnithine racemase
MKRIKIQTIGNIRVQPHLTLDEQHELVRVFNVVDDSIQQQQMRQMQQMQQVHAQLREQQQQQPQQLITIVALNNPTKHNAINMKMWSEIGSVFQQLNALQDCRIIVLMGLGPSFCSGIDMDDIKFLQPQQFSSSEDVNRTKATAAAANTPMASTNASITIPCDVVRTATSRILPKIRHMQDCFTALEKCTIPIIGVVHGYCIGAGVDLLCCTDIRICCTGVDGDSKSSLMKTRTTRNATMFAIQEVKMGFAPDVGTLQRLPKLCGGNQSVIHELCYTGRPFDSKEAMDLGLVSSRHCKATLDESLHSAIYDIAYPIVQLSPVAIQTIKESLLYSRHHPNIDDGLQHIAYRNAYVLQSQDVQTALTMQKQQTKNAKDQPNKKATDVKVRTFPNMFPHSKL